MLSLRNTTCDWPPTGFNSIHHHSLGSAIQPLFYPAKSTSVQAISSQFLQEDAVGNGVKGFTKASSCVSCFLDVEAGREEKVITTSLEGFPPC